MNLTHEAHLVTVVNGGRNTIMLKMPPQLVANYKYVRIAVGGGRKPGFILTFGRKPLSKNCVGVLTRNKSHGYINMSQLKQLLPAEYLTPDKVWHGKNIQPHVWFYVYAS